MTYSKNLTVNILQNNPVWTQLLGLCPLLAVSNTVANALALALASSFVLISSEHPYIYPAIPNSRFHAITLLRANNFHVYNNDSSNSRSVRLRDLSSGSVIYPDHSNELCNFGESRELCQQEFHLFEFSRCSWDINWLCYRYYRFGICKEKFLGMARYLRICGF